MTKKPFSQALPELLAATADEEGKGAWSIRHLSRETRKNNRRGLSHGALNAMVNGHLPPTKEALEVIAAALMIPPKHFPEWRLEDRRAKLNWRVVGVRRALKELGE